MSRTLAVRLVFALSCSPAMAGNFATCLLDNLPGTQNAAVHAAAVSMCVQQNPNRFYDIQKGSGRGFFGYSSGTECTIDKGKNTTWADSAILIGVACECLYTKGAKGNFCENPFKRFHE